VSRLLCPILTYAAYVTLKMWWSFAKLYMFFDGQYDGVLAWHAVDNPFAPPSVEQLTIAYAAPPAVYLTQWCVIVVSLFYATDACKMLIQQWREASAAAAEDPHALDSLDPSSDSDGDVDAAHDSENTNNTSTAARLFPGGSSTFSDNHAVT
jgi:hypothetical protein